MLEINSETKLLGLIGNPVKHSLSPVIHNTAIKVHGLNLVYLALPVEPLYLEAALKGMAAIGFKGFNVTIPHKEAVLPFLDSISSEGKMIGAINTVVINQGKLRGYNTDGIGFIRALEEKQIDPTGMNILILGAGGAAKAVAVALALRGAGSIVIGNRSFSRAQELAEKIAAMGTNASAQPLERLKKAATFSGIDLLVNTTPVGMNPEDRLLIPVEALPRECVVCDLVYGPQKSRLLREAGKGGHTAVDGSAMLLHQGAAAFSLFTGLEPPLAEMRQALHVALCQNM